MGMCLSSDDEIAAHLDPEYVLVAFISNFALFNIRDRSVTSQRAI
jgi:hypothetical protein